MPHLLVVLNLVVKLPSLQRFEMRLTISLLVLVEELMLLLGLIFGTNCQCADMLHLTAPLLLLKHIIVLNTFVESLSCSLSVGPNGW